MIKTFTQNDVVRYLYDETTTKQQTEIAQAVLCDEELQTTYKELSTMKNKLELGLKEPSEKVVSSIINYSRNR